MVKKMNLVSVVIPAFNSSDYIKRAINSVLNQTYKKIEIIVVDDGSTDNTEEILSNYIKKKEIIYLKKKNGGPASARNLGIEKSRGNYIAFLDSDDIWEKTKIKKQLEVIYKKPKSIIFTARYFIDSKQEDSCRVYSGKITKHLIKHNFIINSSVLIPAEILKNNLLNEGKRFFGIEDYELWLRLSPMYNFEYLPEKLVGYTIHNDQITQKDKAQVPERVRYMYRKLIFSKGFIKYSYFLFAKLFSIYFGRSIGKLRKGARK